MNSIRRNKDIVFAISAGAKHGLGHLMRCAVLAREVKRQGMRVSFVLKGDSPAYTLLKREVTETEILEWNNENLSSLSAGVVVFDTRLDIERECAITKGTGSRLVLLDRVVPETDAVDLYILPNAHSDIPRSVAKRTLAGPNYIIISEVFTDGLINKTGIEKKDAILITLGGSDPFNITCKVMDACYLNRDRLPHDTKISIIIGPSNQYAKQIGDKARGYGMEVVYSPDQKTYCDCLLQSFLVVIGFGIAVYEVAYLGIPEMFITHHKEDDDGARKLESIGLGWFLGYGPELTAGSIMEKCLAILGQTELLNKRPGLFLDGKGALRIVERLSMLI